VGEEDRGKREATGCKQTNIESQGKKIKSLKAKTKRKLHQKKAIRQMEKTGTTQKGKSLVPCRKKRAGEERVKPGTKDCPGYVAEKSWGEGCDRSRGSRRKVGKYTKGAKRPARGSDQCQWKEGGGRNRRGKRIWGEKKPGVEKTESRKGGGFWGGGVFVAVGETKGGRKRGRRTRERY